MAGPEIFTGETQPLAFEGRPTHEKLFLLLLVGYPARDRVPVFATRKKPLAEISTWL